MTEFAFSAKSRARLKEFELVNTSDYNIAGHFASDCNVEDQEKRKQVKIVKVEVRELFNNMTLVKVISKATYQNLFQKLLTIDIFKKLHFEKVKLFFLF